MTYNQRFSCFKFPIHLKERLKAGDSIETALTNAHKLTNDKVTTFGRVNVIQNFSTITAQLHMDPSIDDSLSGTTAISVFLHNRTM
jgi:hypothetical protein